MYAWISPGRRVIDISMLKRLFVATTSRNIFIRVGETQTAPRTAIQVIRVINAAVYLMRPG